MSNTDNKRIELKYMLDASQAQQMKLWAREQLGADPHSDPRLGDSYDIHTLYLDSAELDIFFKSGIAGKSKHRIRRYGNGPGLWLETKRKKDFVVNKNRTLVTSDELYPRLTASTVEPLMLAATPWCGDWFLRRIADRNLQPTVQIYYRRFARTAMLGSESMRLTIDSRLKGMAANQWQLGNFEPQRMKDLDDVQILELKFNNQMPHLFKELLREFPLTMTGFSKFRSAVGATQTVTYPAYPSIVDERFPAPIETWDRLPAYRLRHNRLEA